MPELRAIAEDLKAPPPKDWQDAWFHVALVCIELRRKLEEGESRTRKKALKKPEGVRCPSIMSWSG